MSRANYSYPLNPTWNTEEITAVLHFLSQVEKAYESKVEHQEFLEAYKNFKNVVKSKAEEKQINRDFETASGYSAYRALKAVQAIDKGFVSLGK
ncbi:UPF0223 family protein [Streptococcus dentiloxodontae]